MCGISVAGCRRSVDIELVILWIPHADRVVVEPFVLQGAPDGGAQVGQSACLGVDSLFAGLDWVRPLAAGVDVEVQPVLDGFVGWDDLEPDVRAVAVGVADPVCAGSQLLLGYSEVAVVVVSG